MTVLAQNTGEWSKLGIQSAASDFFPNRGANDDARIEAMDITYAP